LIHKQIFNLRQRRTVGFSRRYVLTDADIEAAKEEEDKQGRKVVPEVDLQKLWMDLEPENDAWDRRLLLEVTGKRQVSIY